jgi:hypothetical protein
VKACLSSVADPGCLYRIPDPDFYPSRIPDPKAATNYLFFCSHKFHKIKNYFIFEMLKNKIRTSFQRIIELFTQNSFTKLSKIWVWDPRSGIGKKPFPDPGTGSRGKKGTGSRIPDPGPQHCLVGLNKILVLLRK